MIDFTFDNPGGRVVFGSGASSTIADEISRLGFHRVLVTGTPRSLGSLPAPIAREIVAATFTEVVQHVPWDVAERARFAAMEAGADCIVAVGGGSAIGVAKAVARETGIPIIAVPTTYGGSEMTPIWGITREGRKETGRDPRVRPVTVIYDADLTLDFPPHATACSGLNALAHCIEALYAHDANPMSSGTAMQGVLLLTDGLPRLAASPRDPEARGTALEGAWFAGFALGTVSMGLHHKLAHTLGGAFNLPHAETHAVLLPYTAAYNREAAAPTMLAVADFLDAEDAPTALLDLARQIDAPLSLNDLGFRREDIERAATLSVEKHYPNPRPVTQEGVRELLEAALEGDSSYVEGTGG